MVNDTISDMLTRIRNANLASKTRVSVPTTHVHRSICEILEREGFIETFSSSATDSNELILQLKYIRSASQSGGSIWKTVYYEFKKN